MDEVADRTKWRFLIEGRFIDWPGKLISCATLFVFLAVFATESFAQISENSETDWRDQTLVFMQQVVADNSVPFEQQRSEFENNLAKLNHGTQLRYWKSVLFNSAAYAPTDIKEYERARTEILLLDQKDTQSDYSAFLQAMEIVKETIGNNQMDEGVAKLDGLASHEDIDLSDRIRIEIAKSTIFDYNLAADSSAETLTNAAGLREGQNVDPVIDVDLLKAKSLVFHFSQEPETILGYIVDQYILAGEQDIFIERNSVLSMVSSLLLSHGANEHGFEAVDLMQQNLNAPIYPLQEFSSYHLCSYFYLFSGRKHKNEENLVLAENQLQRSLECSLQAEEYVPLHSEVTVFGWANILIATAFDLERIDVVQKYLPQMKALSIANDNFNNKTEVITIEAKLFRAEGNHDAAFEKMREAVRTMYAEKQDQIARDVDRETRLIAKQVEQANLEAELLEKINKSQEESITRLYGLLGLVGLLLTLTVLFGIVLFNARRQAVASRNEAERLSEVKSRFLANMSHEIRTPMSGVLGLSAALQQTSLSQKQHELVTLIRQSGGYMLNILDDILDFARIDKEEINIEEGPFSPRALLESTHSIFKENTNDAVLDVHLETDISPDLVVVGDEKRLRQVLFNLMSNAMKFTSRGQVAIRGGISAINEEEHTANFWVSVEDTGIGMDEQAMKNVFDPFAQADTSKTRKYGGVGLGLSICRQLMESMGGKISVKSTLDKGTIFSFELPVSTSSEKALEANAEPLPKLDQDVTLPRMLIVEDHPMNRRVIGVLLKALGIEPRIVKGGHEALSVYEKTSFDVVMLDIQMPEIDGIQTMKAMREIDKNTGRTGVRYIAFTANALPDHIEEYNSVGFDGILTKPVDANALVQILKLDSDAA